MVKRINAMKTYTTHLKLANNDDSRMCRAWSRNSKDRGMVLRTYFVAWVGLLQR
jgi:hypothetical protein